MSGQEQLLQTACAAERAGASSAMIAAALLHDIGQFLHDYGEDCAERGIDSKHEEAAAAYLAPHIGPVVTEPVRLHVVARRYLCAATRTYHRRLSPQECAAFEANSHHKDALKLRIWDEAGKVKGTPTPDLAHFRPDLEAALTSY